MNVSDHVACYCQRERTVEYPDIEAVRRMIPPDTTTEEGLGDDDL